MEDDFKCDMDACVPFNTSSCPNSPLGTAKSLIRPASLDKLDIDHRLRSVSFSTLSEDKDKHARCVCGLRWDSEASSPRVRLHRKKSIKEDIEDISSRTQEEDERLTAELVDATPRLVVQMSDEPTVAQHRKCTTCGRSDCPAVVPRVGYYTVQQISTHSTPDDCWVVANGFVYDVTRYLAKHPGGPQSILKRAGRDATEDFRFHSKYAQKKLWRRYRIGKVAVCDHSNDQCTVS